jgi:hypothetical protein
MSIALPSSDPPRGRCLKCDYPLQGLTESRCPECGRRFDPADPKTMRFGRRGERTQRWLIKPVGWPTFVLAVAATGGVLALTRWPAVPSSMPRFSLIDFQQCRLFPARPRHWSEFTADYSFAAGARHVVSGPGDSQFVGNRVWLAVSSRALLGRVAGRLQRVGWITI